jgi:O-antigen/teichoic acid export membrane protein
MKTNLKTNIIFSVIGQVVFCITPFFLAPYLSRVLGSTGIGEYSYGYSLLYYFGIVISFGFPSYGTKAIAGVRDDVEMRSKVFFEILLSKLIVFIPVFLLFLFLVLFGVLPNSLPSKMYLAFIPLLFGYFADISFFFQGMEKFRIISIIQIVINIVYMVCVFSLVKSYDDLLIYTILKSFVSFFCCLPLWFLLPKFIVKQTIQFSHSLIQIKNAFFFFLPSLVMTVSPMINQTILGLYNGAKEVAYYEQSYKIVSLVNALVFAISPVMLSRISYLFQSGNIEECQEIILDALHLGVFIVCPAATGLICIAPNFVPLFLGSDFTPAVNVLIIMAVSILFSPINSILINSYFFVAKKEVEVTLLMSVSVIVNLIIGIIIVPKFGAIGAAITTLLISVISFSLYFIFARKFVSFWKLFRLSWKILVSSIVMGLLVFLCNLGLSFTSVPSFVVVIIDILIGMLIFFLGCFLMKESILKSIWFYFSSACHKK